MRLGMESAQKYLSVYQLQKRVRHVTLKRVREFADKSENNILPDRMTFFRCILYHRQNFSDFLTKLRKRLNRDPLGSYEKT